MTTAIRAPVSVDATAEHLFEAARALAPTIRAAAADIERLRDLPPALIDALHETRLFRMSLPRELGGFEADALTVSRVVEELARIDGSVAWCVLIASAGVGVLGFLPPQVAEQIASDPRLVIAGTLMPTGQAVVGDGGYRLTGRWAFASGIRHASWAIATAVVMDGDAPARSATGRPLSRICLVPVAETTVQDTWHTAGMRGTGSHHFVLEDVFVAAERAVDPESILFGSAGATWHSYPLYHCATLLVAGFGSMQLGIAQAALDEFLSLAPSKTPWQAREPLRDQARIQYGVARAQAQLESARAYVNNTLGHLWETVASTGRSTPEQRARVLLAQVYASDTAVDVVETIAHLAGSSAVYTPNRFDQCLRDVRAAAAHRVVSPPIYEAAGRVALGLEAAAPFF
jgi:indole-3-acetate monooxygenase